MTVDCACVIHGDAYSWVYVERLFNSLQKWLSRDIRFHVYTEPERPVPGHMIRHDLQIWPGISGPKRSWWYKIQLFNPVHFAGDMLYLDLDTMIVSDLAWVTKLPTETFWAIADFKYLQKATYHGTNSSMMWFNVKRFSYVWQAFQEKNINQILRRYHGDQDFIHATIPYESRRYFAQDKIQSWRWQCLDGGYDFQKRKHKTPGTGTEIAPNTSVVVFHGHPKPHQVTDPVVRDLWV